MLAFLKELLMTPEHLMSSLVFLIAGGGIFLFLLNRVLIRLKDGMPKTCVIISSALVLTLVPIFWGYHVGFSTWIILPIVILLGLTVGEARRAMLRVRYRGTPPIEHTDIGISFTRPLTHFDLRVARYEVRDTTWKAHPFRIVHISDLHVSDFYPETFYQQLYTHISHAKPDILVITGDFVTNVKAFPLLPHILTPLGTQYQTFAILGNHDYWAGEDKVADIVCASGIHVLRNTCHRIRYRNQHDICLWGYEYPWGDQGHVPHHFTDELRIVLTHTPDNIYRLSAMGATMVFAGHYHAGQIRLPYLGSLVIPSLYGRRFDHGHFVVNTTHLFVTAGVGTATFPIRMYCQPDIFIVDIIGAEHHDG